jgi:hypothetical protein
MHYRLTLKIVPLLFSLLLASTELKAQPGAAEKFDLKQNRLASS